MGQDSNERRRGPRVLGAKQFDRVVFERAVLRTGDFHESMRLCLPPDGSELTPSAPVLVLFHWPKDWRFLTIDASMETPDVPEDEQRRSFMASLGQTKPAIVETPEFFSKEDELLRVFQKHCQYSLETAKDAVASIVQRDRFVAAVVEAPCAVHAEMKINSSHDRFLYCFDWTQGPRGPQFTGKNFRHVHREFFMNDEGKVVCRASLPVSYRIVLTAPAVSKLTKQGKRSLPPGWRDWFAKSRQDARKIDVIIDSIEESTEYDGVIALDLGNNNSTIAVLPSSAAGDHEQIKLLCPDPSDQIDVAIEGEAPKNVPSAVQIVKSRVREKHLNFTEYSHRTGRDAIDLSNLNQGHVVRGAKRILADFSSS